MMDPSILISDVVSACVTFGFDNSTINKLQQFSNQPS